MEASNSSERSMDSVNNTTEDLWKSATVPKATFLILFIFVGVFGNSLLIIIASKCKIIKPLSTYMFTINLAVGNICDCILNMTVLLATTFTDSWDLGSVTCVINAFLMSVLVMEITLGLFVSSLDHVLIVRYGCKYTNFMSVTRASIILGYTWLHVILFNIPILTGDLEASADGYLNCCVSRDNLSLIYVGFTSVICFFLPLVMMTIIYVYLIKMYHTESQKNNKKNAQNHYENHLSIKLVTKTDYGSTKYTSSLFCWWLVLCVPYLVAHYVRQYQNSIQITSLTQNSLLTYTWHVDLVLTWIRFSYVLVLPVVMLLWRKDLRQHFKDHILCRKNNSVVDVPDKEFLANQVNKCTLEIASDLNKIKSDTNRKNREKIRDLGPVVAFQVPVLFATSKGVHIQTFEDDLSESDISTERIKSRKCDVDGSQDYLHFIGDQTSDYDSGNELDPFSVSHPVSSKNLRENKQLPVQNRSVSQPEVRNVAAKKNKTVDHSVAATSVADSGLDISLAGTCNNDSTKVSSNPGHRGGLNSPAHLDSRVTTVPNMFQPLEDGFVQNTVVAPSNDLCNDMYSDTPSQISCVRDMTTRTCEGIKVNNQDMDMFNLPPSHLGPLDIPTCRGNFLGHLDNKGYNDDIGSEIEDRAHSRFLSDSGICVTKPDIEITAKCGGSSVSPWKYDPLVDRSLVEEAKNILPDTFIPRGLADEVREFVYDRHCSVSSQKALLDSVSCDDPVEDVVITDCPQEFVVPGNTIPSAR